MKSSRLSMIGLATLLLILGADLAWLRRAALGGRSIFGFDAIGFDALILPMATILTVGLILAHRYPSRFLMGFEVCGGLMILACVACGWAFPNVVRSSFQPVYFLWSLYSLQYPPNLYLFLTITLSIIATQGLIALAGGWLAENRGKWVLRVPRVRLTMRTMMVLVAIAALGSMGLARWRQYRQENDPWRNAVRRSEEHEARAREHVEAARRWPETAADRLRMAKYEKMAADSFRAEADRLGP